MLVPALVVALLGNTHGGDVLAAVVFALASLTDFVDGYLARTREEITTFGKLMDPLADKLLIVAALISLVSLHRLAAWIAMVIITRELAVTVLRLGATQAGVVIGASLFGKVKTCLQIAAVLAVIAVHGQPPWLSVLLYVTVLVTVLRLGATQAGVVIAASPFGKAKTCLQIAAILAVIAVPGQPLWVAALLYVTVLVTVLSGLDYCVGLRRRLQQAHERSGSAELGRAAGE